LTDADFSNANLTGADFRRAVICNTLFKNAVGLPDELAALRGDDGRVTIDPQTEIQLESVHSNAGIALCPSSSSSPAFDVKGQMTSELSPGTTFTRHGMTLKRVSQLA
jgi:hypothetical protein